MNMKCTAVIQQEENWFVALCLENNVASQGKTIDTAIANLREAIALYYEEELEIPRAAASLRDGSGGGGLMGDKYPLLTHRHNSSGFFAGKTLCSRASEAAT
jgi:predicted RNase H-like HicB family nuclease